MSTLREKSYSVGRLILTNLAGGCADIFSLFALALRATLNAEVPLESVIPMKKIGVLLASAFLFLSPLSGISQDVYATEVPREIIDRAMNLLNRGYLYKDTSPQECKADLEASLAWKFAHEQGDTEPFVHEMKCLDPHSHILTPREAMMRGADMAGSFGGIGVSIRLEDTGHVLVSRVMEGSPADKAGIKAGDILLRFRNEGEVNFTELQGVEFATEKMRGVVGSKFSLILLHDGAFVEIPLIERAVIEVNSVESKVFHGFGYVSISSFTERTGDELEDALEQFKKDGISGVIVDLRNNPGGLLVSALESLYYFSSRLDDVMLTIRHRDDQKMYSIRSPLEGCLNQDPCSPFVHPKTGEIKTPGRFENMKIVILTNGGSASASEIFAGTMKDWGGAHGKTLVVGTGTFGKGVGQALISLGDGFVLVFTTFEFLVGNSQTSIHHLGVTPDHVVEDTRQTPEDTLTGQDGQFLMAVFYISLLSLSR